VEEEAEDKEVEGTVIEAEVGLKIKKYNKFKLMFIK
jgi:hypothetical protein